MKELYENRARTPHDAGLLDSCFGSSTNFGSLSRSTWHRQEIPCLGEVLSGSECRAVTSRSLHVVGLQPRLGGPKIQSTSLSLLPQPAQGSDLIVVQPMYGEALYLVSKTFSLFGKRRETGEELQKCISPTVLRTNASSSLITAGRQGLVSQRSV